jgi:hypothetical protein
MSQDGEEDDKSQPGFINAVLNVLSGSRRLRSPASPLKFDPIQEQNIGQSDGLDPQGIASDEVLLLEKGNDETTPPPEASSKSGKSFRYDEGSQTLANGGSSSGFRYFKPDEDGPLSLSSVVKKAGKAGDDSQRKGLISGLLIPVRDQSKIGDCLQDP